MEILESLKTLVEDTVMSKMENQQNPCGETLNGASGLMAGDEVVVGGDAVEGGIDNVEVGNQGLGVGGVVGGGETGVSSGGVGGDGVEDGENCWGFGGMERGILGNEVVEGGDEPGGVGDVEAVQYGCGNGSGYELVPDVCLSNVGNDEIGVDMLVMQEVSVEEEVAEKVLVQEEIQDAGAEKVVVQEDIQDAGAEKVLMQEDIQEVGAEKVLMQEDIQEVGPVVQEGIQDVGAEKVVMEEEIQDVGAENVAVQEGIQFVMQEDIQDVGAGKLQEGIQDVGPEKLQEGIEEVGDEDVVMHEEIVEIEAGDVAMNEAIEVEMEGTEKVVMQERFEVVGAEKLIMKQDAVGDDEVLMQEGNEEVKAENLLVQEAVEEVGAMKVVMQDGVKDQYASQQNLVDSGNKIDVSTSGISLYVDVFGQVDSGVRGDHSCTVEQGSFERSSNAENLLNGSSALLPENGTNGNTPEVRDSSIYKNAEVGSDVNCEAIACNGHRFSVGDLVWAKTNTQLWWPGVIVQHSDLSNDSAKGEEDHFQVRLFGSGNVLWGRNWQLKPFHEFFDQISRQGSSKSFYYAVEKAVGEIGRRVKLEMTCPCYLEESKITDVTGGEISKKRASKLEELPVLQFEPEKLLARIRCLARDIVFPSTIESKIIQSRLSAFYRSVGHLQLPIHQLKPTDAKSDDQNVVASEVISSKQALKSRTRSIHQDPDDDKNEASGRVLSAEMKLASPILSTELSGDKVDSVELLDCGTNGKLEKSYESRERRKSKYLSFPYVDPSQVSKSLNNEEGNEMADPSDETSLSVRTVKSRDKKRKKSPCRKSTVHNIYVPDVINASSAELLSKLRYTALDCLYPNESKQFDIMQCFVSRFRKYAFHAFTHEIRKEEDTVCMEFENEMGLFKTLSEIENQTEKQIEKEARKRGTPEAAMAAPDVSETVGIGLLEKDSKIKFMSKCRKKETTSPLGLNTKPTDGFPGNISSGSIVIDFQTDPYALESQTLPKKRTRKTKKTPGCPEIKVMARPADLKGSNVVAQLEESSAARVCTPNEEKSERKRKKVATSSNHPMTNGADLPNENETIGADGAVLKEIEVMGPYSLQNIPGVNKEGTNEPFSLHLNAVLAPEQPDVHKNTETSSVMEGIQQTGMLSTVKPELKKRKRQQKAANFTSAIPDLNGNTTESQLSEVKPKRKSRKKKTDSGLLDINLSISEAQTTGEVIGTALLLKFAPEAPMPTPEDLTSAFCTFGPLKDSETKVFIDSGTAQVVFINSSEARTAFCSLEKNSPFGSALVNYRLQVLFAASGVSGSDGGLNMHQVWPAEKVKSPRKPRTAKKPKNLVKPSTISEPQGKSTEAPDLQFVRQNLQMMTSMLENAGDNISPEMRLRLETEIKSLLNRVTSMVGSSSS
ncbi:hypothetical protein ACET3Z_013302 [Daucus carota]